MPACSCFDVTASTNINYVESSLCFWEFECAESPPSYNNGSIFYTATCTGAVVFNYNSSAFGGSYRINGVVQGNWSIGSSGTFTFSVNSGDVLSILIASAGTIHNGSDFFGDLAFSAATPTPLPTEPTFTPTVTPSPTPSSTPSICLPVNALNLMSYSYPYDGYITFQNELYVFGEAPFIDIHFICAGNVRLRLFPTALISCSGYAALQINGLTQNIPIDTFTDTDFTIDVSSGDGLSINLDFPLGTIPAGTFDGYVFYNSVISNTPTPTASVTATPFNTNPTSSPTPSPSVPPPTPSVTLSPTPTSTAASPTPTLSVTPSPTPAPPTASPTPSPSGGGPPTPINDYTPTPTPSQPPPTNTPNLSLSPTPSVGPSATPTQSPTTTPIPTPTPFFGYLWSFGYNYYGQLGNVSDQNSTSFVQTYYNSPVWRTLGYVNGQSNVAIKNDGTMWVWGLNAYGNLGDGTTANKSFPVQTSLGGTGWTHAALGLKNLVALKTDGNMYVAGDNSKGQLGVNSTASLNILVRTGFNKLWKYAISGKNSIFALATDNTLWAAGSNAYGQLGNISTTDASRFVQVSTDKTWASIDSQGYCVAAITTQGTLWTWGTNNSGQLGINVSNVFLAAVSSPVQVHGGGSNWTQVAAGYSSFYGLKSDNTLWAWGSNAFGELGDGTTIPRSSPTLTAFGASWLSLAAGVQNVVAIRNDGYLYAWGKNDRAQLGNIGTTQNVSQPTQLLGPIYNIAAISGGFSSTSLLTLNTPAPTNSPAPSATIPPPTPSPTRSPTPSPSPSSTAATPTPQPTLPQGYFMANVGLNINGAMGNNTAPNTNVYPNFTLVTGSDDVWIKSVYGQNYGLAIRSDFTLWSWGENYKGQLGNSSLNSASQPTAVLSGFTDWTYISSISSTSLAIRSNNLMYLWGDNAVGQCGTEDTFDKVIPTQVLGLWRQGQASMTHTAAIRTDGTLWLFGSNAYGQLGTNNRTWCSSPVQECTNSFWRMVSVSRQGTTAAIKTDNTLWLWGSNSYGQLGIGNTINQSSPVQESTLSTWEAVSCGISFVVAINKDGSLWAWGDNRFGQLGTNDTTTISNPVQTYAGGNNWLTISCSGQSIAATRQGSTQIWVWGYGGNGSLGTGNLNNVSSPIQLLASGTNQWQSISAGLANSSVLFSVVPTPTPTASRSPSPTPTDPSPTPTPSPSSTAPSPTPSGSASPTPSPTPEPETRLWMFGDNYFGQLGNNTRVDSKEITRTFYSTSDWATVNCSKYYCTYALKWDGTLWGYGDNEFGQLATSDTNDRSIPTQIIGGGQWSSVNGGLYHAAGIKANGTLWSWGANSYGALGNNTGPIQNYALSSPVQEYSKTSQWAQVSCGADFTIALKKDGTVWSWGWNKYGQSGTGEQPSVYPSYSVPVQEYYHENGWAAITTTLFTAAAIKVNGSLYTWGNGFYGTTGLNNQLTWYYPKPVDITIPTPALAWVRIAGGNLHMLGIKSDSTLWTWGDNSYGQLGDNTTISRSSPVKVPISGQWVHVAGGYNFSAAIKVDGSLWTWGQNRNFSLGNISSAFNVSFPTQVDTGYLKWRTVSAGYYQVGLITSNFDPTPTPTITGSPQPTPSITPSPTPAPLPTLAPQYGQLWLWGDNQYGQIGDDTTVYRSSIVQTICAGQDWNNFSIKYTHTAAIKDDGSLWMWGDNTLGGLGDNTKTSRSSPVQTVSQTYDWLAVSAGYRFTIGLKQDSTLWSWGTNNLGQLGLDSTVAKSSPNQITAGPVVGWQKISAGYLHAAAVARDGSLWCWGNNSYGQVGLVNPTNISQPIQTAIGGNDWQDVSCGRNFTLALKKNGSVWAWGVNAYGQYGNNTVVLRRTPVNVINGTSLWVQISAGNNFSAGLASGIVTTPTPTASASPQPTPSVTPSPTPTSTAPSPTPSGTEPSPTPTPSPSATGPTPSPTSSATVTPTPSPSPSPTTTPSPTPSPDPYRENELNVWYRIFSRFSLEFPIEYQQGQLITYAYRVVTRCRPLQQPLAPFSAPLPCPSRSILTIFATSVTDVCKQLQAMDWIWKIDSMEKYTKPVYSIEEAYLIAKGEYNPAIVEFVPVTFCEYGACADFCIDYFLTEEADMQFEWLPICIPVYNPTTMSYDCQSSIIMGGGSLKIFGSAQVKTNNIISAGIIAVGGEADYTHGPSVQETLSWYGQGFVYIGGSAICTLPDVVTYNDTFYGNCSLELQQQVVIILDEVEQLDTFTTPTGIARTDLCACKNIPLQIALETNFTKQNNFNLFINRNALTFTGNFASTYNENTRRYTYSTTYNTIYESGSWSIICNINCNNDLDNFDVEPIWTLTFMFRNVLDNGQKLDSTIEVWLPASQFCPAFGGNVISFSLAINVKTLTCVANNNTNIVNVFINDGANIFTSAAWNQDPILTISGSPAS
jgi:alpha-tubulin suppressor-like RCC1 family protein